MLVKCLQIHVVHRRLTLLTGDLCHRRSIRCRSSNEDAVRCQNCYDFNVACTYDRPSKRRKHPHAPAVPAQSSPLTGSSNPSSHRAANPLPLHPSTPPLVQRSLSVAASQSQNYFSTSSKSWEIPGETRDATSALILQEYGQGDGVTTAWKAFALCCRPTIDEMMKIYLDIIYPL
jgi:hypothetical protein